MTDPYIHTALAGWISAELRAGVVLTGAVARFMEATFGSCDPAAVLAEADDSEIDSLIELLCYPETSVQIRYEARWGHQVFTAGDQTAVVRILCTAPLPADIVSPSGTRLGSIDIPPFALEAFVQRLNITWRPARQLAEAIEQYHGKEPGFGIRVRLRNAVIAWNASQIGLMERYLAKMAGGSDHFDSSLAFLISILPELAPGTDPYEFLIAKKSLYFQSLCRAEDFERKRLSSNMEIMILQGARAAFGSMEEWRRKMRQIDLVCHTLFGRTQFFQQPGEYCLDVENTDTARQIQDVIRLIS